MTLAATTLRRKQFEKKIQEEIQNGYPSFKKGIAQDLVAIYKVDPKTAETYAFSSEINERIFRDLQWAEHMGTDYWAELIFNKLK